VLESLPFAPFGRFQILFTKLSVSCLTVRQFVCHHNLFRLIIKVVLAQLNIVLQLDSLKYLVAAAAVVVVVVSQMGAVFSSIEEPKYTSIKKKEAFEVRRYVPILVAEVCYL
jgi:hypothetical protein